MIDLMSYITCYNIELTTRCTANCPFCSRVVDGITEKLDLDIKAIQKIPFETTNKIVLSGSLGEPTCYDKLFELIDSIYKRNSNIQIAIATNGYTHDEKWWNELGKKLNKRSYAVFGVDGLEDTHSIYRRGTDFKQIIKNIKSFTSTGAYAVLQTIIFRHNEHQLPEIKKLSDEIGISLMFYRPSKRYDQEFQRPILPVKTQRDIICEGGPVSCLTIVRKELFLNVKGYLCPCYPFSSMRRHYLDEDEEFNRMYLGNLETLNLNRYDYSFVTRNPLYNYIINKNTELCTCNKVCRFKLKDLFHVYGKIHKPKPL